MAAPGVLAAETRSAAIRVAGTGLGRTVCGSLSAAGRGLELVAQQRRAGSGAGEKWVFIALEAGGTGQQTKLAAVAEHRAVGARGAQGAGAVARAHAQGAQIRTQSGHAVVVAENAVGVEA